MRILVVVDVQNDFFTGALANEDAVKIIPNLVSKIDEACNDDDTFVLFTKDSHLIPAYYETEEGKSLRIGHCIRGTDGADIIPELRDYAYKKSNAVLTKDTYGCKDLISLIESKYLIKDLSEIEFVGVCTDVCVITNALLARTFAPKVHIKVDASCCAGVTQEKHLAAIDVMKSCNIEVINESSCSDSIDSDTACTERDEHADEEDDNDDELEKEVEEKLIALLDESFPYLRIFRGIFE